MLNYSSYLYWHLFNTYNAHYDGIIIIIIILL